MQTSTKVAVALLLLLLYYVKQNCVTGFLLDQYSTTTSKSGNVGREFVFALIDVLDHYDHSSMQTYMEIGAKEGGEFFVYHDLSYTNRSYFIIPYGHVSVSLDTHLTDGTYLDHNAIRITSNTDISVLVTTASPYSTPYSKQVSYVVYPVSSSKSRYLMAAAFAPVPFRGYASRVMVVAVTDNTIVNVTDGNKTLVTHLHQMNVFQYDAPDYRDLTGCVITSSEDVIVLAGTSLSLIPSNSSGSYPLVAQMVPARTYRYILPPTEPSEPMFVEVLTELPYNVTIINQTSAITYTAKGPNRYELGTEPVSLLTSVPIILVQYNNPFMAVVPGVDQYISEYSFIIPNTIYSNPYRPLSIDINLVAIVPMDYDSDLLLDGAPFVGTSKYIESVDDKYTVLTGKVQPGFHHMVNKNTTIKFGLLAYRKDPNSSYGFFVGMDLASPSSTSAMKYASTWAQQHSTFRQLPVNSVIG